MSLDSQEQPASLTAPTDVSAQAPQVPADGQVTEAPAQHAHRIDIPILLFAATCYTTLHQYAETESLGGAQPLDYRPALIYAAGVMFILLCHELGHYLQARRYRVSASLPYFIPMPAGPLGTMGAVINMSGEIPNRRALFDIGISGPLAGLVPTLICCVVGLQWSILRDARMVQPGTIFIGEPMVFEFLQRWLLPDSLGKAVELHPLAYAGWVGLFLTSVNLFPIGQLDGGHVLYGMLREKAWPIAALALAGCVGAVVLSGRYEWSFMLALLVLIGPYHPPTANDNVSLGRPRVILGWLTLAFVIIGFTPKPF